MAARSARRQSIIGVIPTALEGAEECGGVGLSSIQTYGTLQKEGLELIIIEGHMFHAAGYHQRGALGLCIDGILGQRIHRVFPPMKKKECFLQVL